MRSGSVRVKNINKQFLQQQKEKTEQNNFAIFSRKYLIFLAIAITAVSLNYFYSIAMMFLTTFILAYLTKGSRSK